MTDVPPADDALVAEVEFEHKQCDCGLDSCYIKEECAYCGDDWPCPTTRLIALIRYLQSRVRNAAVLLPLPDWWPENETAIEFATRTIADHEASLAASRHVEKDDDVMCPRCAWAQVVLSAGREGGPA